MMQPTPNAGSFAIRTALADFGEKMTAAGLNTRNLSDGLVGEVVVGREAEVDQISLQLISYYKPNVLLTGESGNGKTSLVEALAFRSLNSPTPAIARLRIHEISVGALIAGTAYRGDFEKRMMDLIRVALEHPEVVLFFDEAHTLASTADVGGGGMSALDILKPFLLNKKLKVILATTTDEVGALTRDPAFARRFARVEVGPLRADLRDRAYRSHLRALERHYGFCLPLVSTDTTSSDRPFLDELEVLDLEFAKQSLERN